MVDLLKLLIRVDGTDVDKGAKKLDVLARASKGADLATARLMGTVGKLVAAYATFAVAEATVRKFIAATGESERAQRQLATVIASTGGAAGLTLDALTSMAGKLQSLTTYDDEAIEGAQGLLLTFTRIGRDVFPEALTAILDVSTAMGQDLSSSAVQIGKALNDPIRGLTALTRIGVTFDAAQRQQIKTMTDAGNVAGAQAIMLKELEKEFGNSAKAARGTLGGALQALKGAFDNLFESNGPASETLRQSIERLITTISDPQFITAVTQFGSVIFTAISGIATAAATAWGWLTKLRDVVQGGLYGLEYMTDQGLGDRLADNLKQADALKAQIAQVKEMSGTITDADGHIVPANPMVQGPGAIEGATNGTPAASDQVQKLEDENVRIKAILDARAQIVSNTPVVPPYTPPPLSPSEDQIAAAEKMAKAYGDLTLSMAQKIEKAELERKSVGLSADAILQLTNRQDVLQDAIGKGINLDSLAADKIHTKRQELVGYADQLTATQIQTRRLQESQQQMLDTWSAVGDVIGAVFDGSTKSVQDFVDNSLKAFAKLGQQNLQKLFTQDGLDQVTSAWGSSGAKAANDNGGAGGWVNLSTGFSHMLDKMPDAVKEGTSGGLADFMKNNSGTINAGLGGLGVGYSSANPLMGALGGAISGLSAGPIGAVVGGIAGLIGGLIGMNEELEKSRQALRDQKDSIRQLIEASDAKPISEYRQGVRAYNAQIAEAVKLAKAAGDDGLVRRLKEAAEAYKQNLKTQLDLQKQQTTFDAIKADAIKAEEAHATALQNTIDLTRDFISSTRQFQDGLKLSNTYSTLSPKAMVDEAEKQFNLVLKKANLGDATAMGQLQGAASSLLDKGRGYYGSSTGYTKIYDEVQAALGGAAGKAGTRLSTAEMQLDAATKSLKHLGGIADGVKSMNTILNRLHKLETAAAHEAGKDADKLRASIRDLSTSVKNSGLKRRVA